MTNPQFTPDLFRARLDAQDLSLQATPKPGLRRAAVLVPFLNFEGQWRLLFTRRTETVQNHKGQVSFPGGALEQIDSSLEAAALREAHEEIGLKPADVVIWGRLPEMQTITYYSITPVIGAIPWPYPLRISADEVSRAFTIPLTWLADRSNWEEKEWAPRGGDPRRVIFFKPYDGEVLWGISAQITIDLLAVLGLS